MTHHIVLPLLIALLVHSIAAGQDVQLTMETARILPVAQQGGGGPSAQDVDRARRQAGRSASQLAGESVYGVDRHAQRKDGQLVVPQLDVPTTALEIIGNGSLPPGMEEQETRPAHPVPEGPDREGMWSLSTYAWHAPNTFSHPRYFEDAMLERHGHQRFPALQPLVSGFRFYATVPMLPYLMTVRHPWDCEYSLGYFRPGSCAPRLLQRPPYERKAVLVEAASIVPF